MSGGEARFNLSAENTFKDYDLLGFRISIRKKKFRFLGGPIVQVWRQKPVGTFKLLVSI